MCGGQRVEDNALRKGAGEMEGNRRAEGWRDALYPAPVHLEEELDVGEAPEADRV